jgi:hypothetical protein
MPAILFSFSKTPMGDNKIQLHMEGHPFPKDGESSLLTYFLDTTSSSYSFNLDCAVRSMFFAMTRHLETHNDVAKRRFYGHCRESHIKEVLSKLQADIFWCDWSILYTEQLLRNTE